MLYNLCYAPFSSLPSLRHTDKRASVMNQEIKIDVDYLPPLLTEFIQIFLCLLQRN